MRRCSIQVMRSILCTLVILSLWIPQAPAQSAVLIGLHVNTRDDGNGKQPSSYRTFLITFRDGKAQLAADLPDLIVPRKDGFWRVGTLHKGPPGKHGDRACGKRCGELPADAGLNEPASDSSCEGLIIRGLHRGSAPLRLARCPLRYRRRVRGRAYACVLWY